MTRTAQANDLPPSRFRSRDEMEETYRHIIVRDPTEGPALVDTHRRLIALLDEMVVKTRRER